MAKDRHPLRIISLPFRFPKAKKTAEAVFFLSHWPDSNRRPTHYECVDLPTEQKKRINTKEISQKATTDKKRMQKKKKKMTFANKKKKNATVWHFWNNFCILTMQNYIS